MKILRITLRNIASLADQHTVNFTQEPLRSAGIYAISGDTGSGKSSLLDAMCLALYGKTPRLKSQKNSLEKINEDEQQLDPRSLLRRGTAEGMAEVAFIGVDGKKWTARWTVRRARKNVSGKLQHVERTLFEGHIEPGGEGTTASGGKKTEVDAAIQEKLGLTFDQFTRAVLLAQNEFAVFLQSDDKARAEILQALTGTGRFEDLSKAAFERCRTERQKLLELKSQLKGTSILPEEERIQKDAQLAEIIQQISDLQAKLKQLETQQAWHSKLKEHTKSLEATQTELTAATAAHTTSQPRKDQLRFTQEALRHAEPKKQAVIETTAQLKQCEGEAKDAAEKHRQLEAADKTIAAEFEAAKSTLKEAHVQAEQLQPKLLEAAKIEETIRIKTDDLKKAEKNLEEVTKEAESKKSELQETQQRQKQAVKKQQKLQSQQLKIQVFQPFADAADLWIERLKQATETSRKISILDAELKAQQLQFNQLQKQQDKNDQLWKQQIEVRSKAEEKLQTTIAVAQKFDRQILIEQRTAADERRELWDGFYSYLEAIDEHQKDLTDCEKQLQQCVNEIQQQDADLKQLIEADVPVAKQTVESQRAALQTVQSAISDEAVRLRTELTDDQPCSVCGSVQHPYSAHPPSDDQTAVKALKQLLETAEAKLQELNQRQSKVAAERKANTTRQQEYLTHQKQLNQQLKEIKFADLDHPEIQPVTGQDISKQIQKAQQQRSEIAAQLKQLNKNEKDAAAAQSAVEANRKAFEKAQQKEQTAQQASAESKDALSAFQADRKNQQQRLDELKIQQKNQLLPLQELFSQITDSETEFNADSEAFQAHFAKSVKLVGSVTKQLSEIEALLKQYSDKLETITPIAAKSAAVQDERQTEANDIREQISQLQIKQTELFDGRTAAEVQQETAKQNQLAEERVQKAEEAKAESQTHLATATEAVIQADKQKDKAKQKATAAAANLATWLEEFNSVNQLQMTGQQLDTMLDRDDEWLRSEQDALQALAASVQTKTGQLETLQTQHKAHLESRPSEKTLEQITESQKAALEQQQTLQQSKDEIQKALNVDDAQRKNNETVQQQIAEQEIVASPWMRLNEVIGSADGSAFRNIAQRHTLDILLQFSNHQLSLLSGRYRLERIPNSLNLMVVDQDMADERRSIHSLSGGESFLVSLALALGLASLTSNRLKIESLFIDEGFGSLDPNTLDLAMNALMQLESQGRKVGIISHVTAMTDAIPVQIKVKKGPNGASTIEVPTTTQVVQKPRAVKTTSTQRSLFADPDSET